MKKLLLILSAVLVSVMAWAAESDKWTHPNPFAYDLKSEIIESGTKLKLTYSLNANAVTSDTYNNDHGLQIYLIDENGNRIKNDAGTANWACTSGAYTKGTHSVTIPVIDLPSAAKGKPILWEVQVHGNEKWTKPKAVSSYLSTQTTTYKPRAAHGIAVDKDPLSKWFGRIFVAEASTAVSGKNSVLEYDMLFNYKGYHHKDKYDYGSTSKFNSTTNYEPHRVKISDDGRMFVTCYSPTATAAVLEYLGGGVFRKIVRADEGKNEDKDGSLTAYPANEKYNRRPIAMDVRGSGENLNIIVAWVVPKGRKRNNQWDTKIEVYEYKVGKRSDDIANNQGLDQDDGTLVATYIEANPTDTYAGHLFTGYCNGYNCTNHAFVGLAYGGNDTYPIWMKVDFGFGTDNDFRAQILNFTSSKKTIDYKDDSNSGNVYRMPTNTTYRSSGGYYGGAGLYVKGNQLFTGSGNNAMLRYTIGNNNSLQYKDTTKMGDPGTSTWLDAFAEDYAGNLYCVSEAADNIVVVAMPYDGTRITRASASQSFNVSDPVPNILATDLKYEPVGTTDKYIFSFITNTKPTNAEIRFYKKENIGTMNSNIATIHADTYNKGKDATTPPDYVYTFSPEDCKQGLMSATFKMVGGDVNSKVVIDALPPGEMYWSVYVETEKSTCFAPIYRSESYSTGTFHPLHATVNNYPETDMFGSLFVANNSDWSTDERITNGLLVYGLNPSGNANEFKLDDRERYEMRANYLNERITSGLLNYPRRMAVAPDGKVYIADEGAKPENWVGDFNGYKPVVVFSNGGIKVWDPKQPTQISTFTGGQINTASGVAFWGDPANKDSWKIYYSNTYDEFSKHVSNDKSNYTEEQQDNPTYYNGTNNSGYGWNGLVVHQIGNSKPSKELALGMGDASGNISVVAMEKGVWLCQYREHTVIIKDNLREPYADNMGAYLLSFVPYDADNRSTTYNPRTWTSCTTHGRTWSGSYPNFTYKDFDKSWWSQTQSSPLQSTPGGGLAYRKIDGEEFLFVVNHDGNIVKIKIDGWTGSGKSVKPTMTTENDRVEILQTPGYTKYTKQAKKDIKNARGEVIHTFGPYDWTTSYINSMEFDYAGNLVTVTGSAASHSGATHEIIIYTMPYDRTNAQEIRAPESYIYIPERLHQMAMEEVDIQGVLNRHTSDGACAVDLYRPLQGGMFNTICLPFVLEMDHLNNPLAGSEVRQFTGATIESIGGENILCLKFTEVSTIQFNIPYIIKPQQNIKQIMRFNWPVTLAKSTEVKPDPKTFDTDNKITYQGILPKTDVEALYDPNTNLPLRLILVADNRLAVLTGDGEMYGFRGYFDLLRPLPPGTVAKISAKKDTPTNTTIVVDGKKVNIEKYLREGRVYIRVGDSLYTVDGQLVK